MKANKSAGLFLIVFGSLYLGLQVLNQFDIVLFNVWDFWPLTTIGLGIVFEAIYFSSKRYPGFLIPGGLLTTIGCLHLFEVMTRWHFAGYTWPIYILAIFIGFFQYYLYTREQWSKIMSIILFIIFAFNAFIALSSLISGMVNMNLAFSIVIIIIGALLIFSTSLKKNQL